MRILYNSFIYPHLTYCIEVWGNICKTHMDPLVKIHKRAVRTIVGARIYEHTQPIIKKLKLLNLNEIYIYFVQLFMYKYHHEILPSVFEGMFVSNSSIHTHFTRQHHQLHVPPPCKSLLSRSVRVTGVKTYNFFDNVIS